MQRSTQPDTTRASVCMCPGTPSRPTMVLLECSHRFRPQSSHGMLERVRQGLGAARRAGTRIPACRCAS